MHTSSTIPREAHESARAHAACVVYLTLGPGRSIEKVRGQSGGKAGVPARRSTLEEWSAKFHWVERAATYDAHIAAVAQEAEEAALREAARLEAELWAQRRREQREREWELSQRLFQKAEQMLAFPLQRITVEDGTQVIEPAKWSFATAAQIVEAAAKLARLAAEIEQGRVIVSFDELRKMTDEEFAKTAAQFGVALDVSDPDS